MRITAALVAVFLACAIYGCNSTVTRLPEVGQVIYCQNCDTDLYQRVSGTSRTAFRRSDYVQLRFDMVVPAPGDENICPMCNDFLTTLHDDGMLYTHFRDAKRD